MKVFKNKKIFLNLVLVILSALPFFILIGNLIQFDYGIETDLNFYHFLQKNEGFAGNFMFLFIISLNFLLLTFNFVYSMVKTPKSLQNIIIFVVSGAFTVSTIVHSFFIKTINNISQFITVVPIMVAMVGFLILITLAIRLILEIKINE